MSSSNYFHRINHIKEIPFQWEINFKNGHQRLYYDLNISNGKRKVSMNLGGEWKLCLVHCQTQVRLPFVFLSVWSLKAVFSVEVVQCSVQSCPSVLLLFVPGGLFKRGTSWHLAKTNSLFTFELLYRREHLRPHASCGCSTLSHQMKSTNRTARTEPQTILCCTCLTFTVCDVIRDTLNTP